MSSSLSTICRHAITHCANVENMPQFGHRIRSARERAKLKAEDVAEAVGYSSKYVYALENGTNTPNWQLLADFATKLECSADYLLGLVDEPQGRVAGLSEAEERLLGLLRLLGPSQIDEAAQLLAHYMALPADQRQAVDRQIESLSFLVRTLHAAYVPRIIGGE